MSIKLRELIRRVRTCKTAAEERATIRTECAEIRTAIKDEDSPFRHRNLAKLMYISMLGYSTSFAQMEVLRLIASGKFPEKRIGYLGLSVLMDEEHEVLMLITNTIQRDIHQSSHPYVVGLALTALANVANAEMGRSTMPMLDKLCRTGSGPFIKKKAALACVRVLRKAPELAVDMLLNVPHLISDKDHAVQLGAVQLIQELCVLGSGNRKAMQGISDLVPDLLKLLRSLSASGYAPDYDISGITDPFLQCRLIRTIRMIAKDPAVSVQDQVWFEDMCDVLALVSNNTDITKNPGNAILYECVLTTLSVDVDSGLRSMGIEKLGRLLVNRDNNIRYVALNTLCQCAVTDQRAIQRHRNTIVDNLRDPDISIRRRALDLVNALVDKDTIRDLVKELISFLEASSIDDEFTGDLTDVVCSVVDRFAPSPHWQINTFISILEACGPHTKALICSRLLVLISQNSEIHAFIVYRLYYSLINVTIPEPALTQVALWTIGEFSDLLCSPEGASEAADKMVHLIACDDVVQEHIPKSLTRPSETDVLDLLDSVLSSGVSTPVVQEYALTALLKMSTRLSQPSSLDRISDMLDRFSEDHRVELQSRACEFSTLIGEDMDSIRNTVLAPIPALDPAIVAAKKAALTMTEGGFESSSTSDSEGESDDGDDSDNILTANSHTATASAAPVGNLLDIDDLFGNSSGQTNTSSNPADDIMSSLFTTAASPVSVESPKPVTAISQDGLSITFAFDRLDSSTVSVMMSASNSTEDAFSDFQILVAVPKYLSLKMHAASGDSVAPSSTDSLSQRIDLVNSGTVSSSPTSRSLIVL